jgi:hypothetical protein
MAIEVDPHLSRSPRVGLRLRGRDPAPRATVAVAIAGVLLAVTVLVSWLATGVSLGDIGRFVAFEALWVCLPGCMLYVLLSRPGRGWLSVLALGWPLGHAIEIGAFALTAALGERDLFDLLPVLALALMGPPLARTYARPGRARLRDLADGLGRRLRGDRGMPIAVLAITVAVGVVVIALRYFVPYPLPGHFPSVAYLPDDVYAISLAAEALHHWPLTEPYVAGQALHFYPGVFIHIAAVSQAVGIAPSTVVLRLFPTTMLIVVVLQLWLICRQLGGSIWVGAVAAILFVIVGELNLDVTRFENDGLSFFNMLGEAPTNALGFTFFLALFVILQRQFADEDAVESGQPPTRRQTPRQALGSLAMVAILAYAASAVKTQTAADLVGGLGAVLLIGRLLGIGRARLQWGYALVLLACMGAFYGLALVGGISPYRVQPFAFVHYTVFDPLFPAHSVLRLVALTGAAAVVYACLFVPLLGVAWLLRRSSGNRRSVAFALAVFAVALVSCTALAGSGDNEVDFLTYGYIAMVPVASLGLTHLWEQVPRLARARIALACVAILLAGLAVAASSYVLVKLGTLTSTSLIPAGEGAFGPRRLAWGLWYVATYGLLAATIGLMSLRLGRTLVTLHSRGTRVVACCIPLVLALGLVKPIAGTFPEVWKTVLTRRAVQDSSEDQGMSAALFTGLLWVRDHTSSCAILAVNNHSLKARIVDSRYFYYSAFAERRVYLESWEYPAHWNKAQPYPARMAINTKAISQGDPSALRDLARMGVDYVLVDRTHGGGAREPADVSTLVFANSALDVYRLKALADDAALRTSCGSHAAA